MYSILRSKLCYNTPKLLDCKNIIIQFLHPISAANNFLAVVFLQRKMKKELQFLLIKRFNDRGRLEKRLKYSDWNCSARQGNISESTETFYPKRVLKPFSHILVLRHHCIPVKFAQLKINLGQFLYFKTKWNMSSIYRYILVTNGLMLIIST